MRAGLIESVTPDVKQSASYAELACEPNNVVARVHSLNSLLPKLVRVSLPPFFRSTLLLLSREVCYINLSHSRRSLQRVKKWVFGVFERLQIL